MRHDPARPPRYIRPSVGLLMLAVAVLAILLTAARLAFEEAARRHDPGHRPIHCEGDRLAEALEAWRRAHGRYPRTLAEAALSSTLPYAGGFRYEPEGSGFVLWIGEPDGVNMRHAFSPTGSAWTRGLPGWQCAD